VINKGLYTSNTDEWSTPQAFFDELNKEFNFNLDPCATTENAKCKRYYTKEHDGLKMSWGGYSVYMNPPYGREIGKWVKKAYEEKQKGAKVVCLLPARTDTRWFHEYIWDKEEDRPREGVKIRFEKGRLKFGDSKNAAPFPSMVVIFSGRQ
jgi:phage N-6-adenine-methyltransferase